MYRPMSRSWYLLGVFLPTVNICLTVFNVGASTNCHTNIQFGWSTKSNKNVLTNTRLAVNVFFQLLNSVVVLVLWPFYRAHIRISCACRRQTYLHRNTWQVRYYIFFASIRCCHIRIPNTFLSPLETRSEQSHCEYIPCNLSIC